MVSRPEKKAARQNETTPEVTISRSVEQSPRFSMNCSFHLSRERILQRGLYRLAGAIASQILAAGTGNERNRLHLSAAIQLRPQRFVIAQKLLTGWHEITSALDMKYQDRGKIKSLNQRFNGPIKNRGQGTQPIVESSRLLEWWNKLAVEQQELANRQQGATLSGEAQHNYGRTGTVAPEIKGSVKERRCRLT